MRIEDVRKGMKVVFNRAALETASVETVGRDVVPFDGFVLGEVVKQRHENHRRYPNISRLKLSTGLEWWYDASLFDPLNQEDF